MQARLGRPVQARVGLVGSVPEQDLRQPQQQEQRQAALPNAKRELPVHWNVA